MGTISLDEQAVKEKINRIRTANGEGVPWGGRLGPEGASPAMRQFCSLYSQLEVFHRTIKEKLDTDLNRADGSVDKMVEADANAGGLFK